MQRDEEGFLYPVVDEKRCIECGACKKACPVINASDERIPQETFAVVNGDEKIRVNSSSGGFFSALAECVIKQNGIVFGARFDDEWQVVIDYFDDIMELPKYRGAKYVQAIVGDAYKKCKKFLDEGRKVLFCGTPCQIAGLKKFLRKNYENLLTCDVVCHGVPSPLVWSSFLREYCQGHDDKSIIKKIVFRDKHQGWKNYNTSFEIQLGQERKYLTAPYRENVFMKAFLHDLILRPSCYRCMAKSGKSLSDFTIGDCWNSKKICPDFFDDDKGVSLVLAYSDAAVELLHSLKAIRFRSVSFQECVRFNPCITTSARPHKNRKKFFLRFAKGKNVLELIHFYTKPTFFEKAKKLVRRIKRRSLL